MKEKLQEYALIAEIVGGVAIVLSLIFVGIQVQQGARETAINTEATLSANRQSISARFENLSLLQATTPELAQIRVKTIQGADLSPVETIQWTGFVTSWIRLTEEAYLQYRDGNLSEEYWQTRVNSLFGNLFTGSVSARGISNTLRQRKMLTEDFQNWLDQAIEDLESNKQL